jgi:hypothetical protein
MSSTRRAKTAVVPRASEGSTRKPIAALCIVELPEVLSTDDCIVVKDVRRQRATIGCRNPSQGLDYRIASNARHTGFVFREF